MSKYTTEFGNLIRTGFRPFDDTWCTFVEGHKKELCDKIIRYYWFNEIGAETPERFKHYLNEQLSREMPYFNRLYEAELWKLFPLCNTVLNTKTHGTLRASDIRDAITRRDLSRLAKFGESLHHDLKDDDWTKFDQNVHGVTNQTGNLTGNHDETEHISTSGTKDYIKNQDNNLDETANRDINTVTESKEVVDDDTTSHTTGNESRNTTSSHWSSDTPQGAVIQEGVAIDSKYLTNYSHDSENMSRNYSEDVTGTDDKTTDFNQTVKTDDDLTRNVKENNKETYDEDTTGTSDRSKNNKDTEDTTGWKDENTDTESTTHYTRDEISHDFKQNTTTENETNVDASSQSGQNEQESDNLVTVEGSTGVSRTRLLMDYRESIINIDEMIIKSLGINFMGVF